MKKKALFRQSAINARQVRWLGDIVLLRPISFTILTAIALALASILVCFAIWATYTKHSTITGQLVPDGGLLRVYAPQPGVVVKRLIKEGQEVKQGDVLFFLSSDRHSPTQGDVQATISTQVENRRQSLFDEREKTHEMQIEDRAALQRRIADLHAELDKLDHQTEAQKAHVKLSEDSVARYDGLLKQNYVSREQVQQKQEDLLDQRSRLDGMERDYLEVKSEFDSESTQLASLNLKQQNQLAAIDRSIASEGQQFAESEAKRSLAVTAPESGTVTAITAEMGQNVDGNHALVSIVPSGAVMQAQLYAQSKAIGFIKPGDQVLLRYQAYPYQKFGHAKGVVLSVSLSALPSSELSSMGEAIGSAAHTNEPLYLITVGLASQTVRAYGKQQPLQAGMLLDADVMQDTRHLYEWILEPLYSLTGKL